MSDVSLMGANTAPCFNPWCLFDRDKGRLQMSNWQEPRNAMDTVAPAGTDLWHVRCGCGTRGPAKPTKEAAHAAWNDRMPPSGNACDRHMTPSAGTLAGCPSCIAEMGRLDDLLRAREVGAVAMALSLFTKDGHGDDFEGPIRVALHLYQDEAEMVVGRIRGIRRGVLTGKR